MRTAANLPARILLAVALLAGIPAMIHSLVFSLETSPAALTAGLPFVAAYLVVAFLILRISPAWPRGPVWWMLFALIWGGGTAFLFVTLAGSGLSTLTQQLNVPMFSASLAGALPEEIGKGLGVLVIVLACRNIDRPWHVLAVATMVGLGFTIVEDIGYGANGGLTHPSSDAAGVTKAWLTRSFTGVGIHCVYTALCGWGISRALFTPDKSRAWRIGMALLGFMIGFGLHFAWNASGGSPLFALGKVAVLAVTSYVLYIVLYVGAWKKARREKKLGTAPATTPLPS